MLLRRLDATFGKLERRTLTFSPGLNIIEAPNEAGKSTLTACLRAMLYGLPTRDRGALADKNRYLPWSGAPMQGTLELTDDSLGDVTLRRDTARSNSPMGRFSATYTGTGNDVPDLNAADCGEILLGVPREVYERSAFIRQCGLAIDQNAELERRIAALITTGEEGTSYTEAAAALKKQLNARRSNARNGLIPSLEREIEADTAALTELRTLQAERTDAEETLAALRGTETALRADLATHDIADKQEQFAAREQMKRAADKAAREARLFRRMLEDTHIPPREVLDENRSRLHTVEDLERRIREASAQKQDAELALNHFDARPKPSFIRPIAAIWFVLLLLCAVFPPAALLADLPIPSPILLASASTVVLFAVLFTLESLHARELRRKHGQERSELETALRDAEASCAALKTASEQALAAIYADIPAGDFISASTYIHENLARYDMLAQMETDVQIRRHAYDAFPWPDLAGVPAYPAKRPERSADVLRHELEHTVQSRAEAQSRVDYITGRLHVLGSASELENALEEKKARLAAAQEEYDAIALAMETLERANTALQNHFSPELGKRAAEYFSALTDGKYDAVSLDRTFHALASESGESVARDAALLSQGAGDQLYLAVRLAVCDMVLPAEKHVPLVLDDALVSFDDTRCRAALRLLCEAAKSRQILLLTCQHREAACLQGQENVTILTL